MRITRHGRLRLRERAGVKKSNAIKAVMAALRGGLTIEQLNGDLGRYAEHTRDSHGLADQIIIYHQKIYLFCNESLLTVLNLPVRFHRAEAKLKARHRQDPDS